MLPTRLPQLNEDHLAISFAVALLIAILGKFAPVLIHDEKRRAVAPWVVAVVLLWGLATWRSVRRDARR